MEDRRIYILAQFDENTNQTLSSIYDNLLQAGLTGEQTKEIPYHFTLESFDLNCEPQVLERVKAVCAETKAFDVGFTHIGLFGMNVLFLAPSVNIPLLKLYEKLIPNAEINSCHNWVPHATILIDSPGNIQTALPIVAQSFSSFNAKISSIGVYEFFPKKLIAEYNFSS
jgi:hypothetical protein